MRHTLCGGPVVCRRKPDRGSPLGAVLMIPHCARCRRDVPVEELQEDEAESVVARRDGGLFGTKREGRTRGRR